MPLMSATYRLLDARTTPDGGYLMPHGLDTRAWSLMNARWYRLHQKSTGTIGSSLHPQKRSLWVWLSKDLTELYSTVFFADSEQGWDAAAAVEKGLFPAASVGFLPLRTFGGAVTPAELGKMLRGFPDGAYVVKSLPDNWYREAALNEISLVPEGHHPAAALIDWTEGKPCWRPIWQVKAQAGRR
jgi:hypothetical protein